MSEFIDVSTITHAAARDNPQLANAILRRVGCTAEPLTPDAQGKVLPAVVTVEEVVKAGLSKDSTTEFSGAASETLASRMLGYIRRLRGTGSAEV